MLPKVGIIVLTWHRKETIEDLQGTFASLVKSDYPLDRIVLICEENWSPHGQTWPWIEKEWLPRAGKDFPRIINVQHPTNAGYSGGNNIGLPAARVEGCDYVYLLNQDSDVDPSFITKAVERAEADPKVAFVQSLIMLGNEGERDLVNSSGNKHHFLGFGYSGGYRQRKAEALAELERERVMNPKLAVGYVSGAGLLCRMSFVEQYGIPDDGKPALFDGKFFMYHEDTDATFNARIHGFEAVIEPSSIIYHHYQFSRSVSKFYWMERNRFMMNLTYLKLGTLLLLLPAFVGVELISLVFAIRSGWYKEKLKSWAYFWKPSTWAWVWQRRRHAMRVRTIGDRELLRHSVAEILFQEGDAPSSVVTKIANPLMRLYWKIAYWLIRW
jgi:GT2 family glycosyltransferase